MRFEFLSSIPCIDVTQLQVEQVLTEACLQASFVQSDPENRWFQLDVPVTSLKDITTLPAMYGLICKGLLRYVRPIERAS